jgi:hypothetical protein
MLKHKTIYSHKMALKQLQYIYFSDNCIISSTEVQLHCHCKKSNLYNIAGVLWTFFNTIYTDFDDKRRKTSGIVSSFISLEWWSV